MGRERSQKRGIQVVHVALDVALNRELVMCNRSGPLRDPFLGSLPAWMVVLLRMQAQAQIISAAL